MSFHKVKLALALYFTMTTLSRCQLTGIIAIVLSEENSIILTSMDWTEIVQCDMNGRCFGEHHVNLVLFNKSLKHLTDEWSSPKTTGLHHYEALSCQPLVTGHYHLTATQPQKTIWSNIQVLTLFTVWSKSFDIIGQWSAVMK